MIDLNMMCETVCNNRRHNTSSWGGNQCYFAVIMHMHNMHGPTMVSMAICIYKCIMHLSKTKINPMVQLLLLKSISFIAVHIVSHAQAVLLVSTTRMLMYSYRFALARSSTTYIT